ncbi:MAG: D-2-hydroxyacid dehydrogenase [Planctomycetia bacterium]|nr:D-2-hydroxyacid dehydrogenase [Planctomycetia bacterium]
MKIVILDGYALNPGDLDYSPLAAYGELVVYDRSHPDQYLERANDAEILLGNKIILGEEQFAQLPRLKYVGIQATGYNLIDTAAARKRGIVVTNVPAYSTASVAQLTFAHLLNLAFHLGEHTSQSPAKWPANPDFVYWDSPLVELAGKTLGLVGFGNIAKQVARVALAFDMRVVACRRNGGNDGMNVEIMPVDEVFRQGDVVSLHCPATPETVGLVNAQRLALMKPTAFLINTSRGALVEESALADALNAGKIAGAGVDVLSTEPPQADNPLFSAKNFYATPHFAWATRAARERCLRVVLDNVRAFVEGKPINVVS